MFAPLSKNPNFPDPHGWTPIQRAAHDGELEIIKILAPMSENVNTVDPDGWTPLQRAVKDGKSEIIKLLIPISDNINATDPDGWTPIQRATKYNKIELLKLLAPSFKNLKISDPEGLTPIQRVQKRKRQSDEAWDYVKSISKDQGDNVMIKDTSDEETDDDTSISRKMISNAKPKPLKKYKPRPKSKQINHFHEKTSPLLSASNIDGPFAKEIEDNEDKLNSFHKKNSPSKSEEDKMELIKKLVEKVKFVVVSKSASTNDDFENDEEQKQLQEDQSESPAAKKVEQEDNDVPMPKECIPCKIVLKDSSKVVSHWLENETCFKAHKESLATKRKTRYTKSCSSLNLALTKSSFGCTLEGSNVDKKCQDEQVSKRSKIVDKVSLFF